MFKNNLAKYYSVVKMPGGYDFDTAKTIKKAIAYYDGKMLGSDKDSNGIRKDFFNIVKSTCDVASKFIDLDLKDILFVSNGTNFYQTLIMQRDFKYWAKNSDFALLLNEIKDEYPRGHVVIKKVNGNYFKVPISNLRFNVGAKNLYSSDFVYEVLRMSKGEIMAMKWNKKENIQELFNRDRVDNSYLLYECYEKIADGYERKIMGDVLANKTKNGKVVETSEQQYLKAKNENVGSLVLHEDKVDNIPYRELVWERKDGRLLGYGYPEYLFTNQMRLNEIKHLEKLVMYIKSLHLTTSDDDSIGNNLLNGMNIAQVIKTTGSLVPLRFDNVDTTSFQIDKEDWMRNKTQKTFDTDIARGDNLPSQTPLGLGQLQAQMTASFFAGKTENFGLFIKKLLYEDKIPEFKKARRKSHIVPVSKGDGEYRQLFNSVVDEILYDNLKRYRDRGIIPTLSNIEEMRSEIEAKIDEKGVLPIEVPDDYYKDIDLFDIVITGESVNVQQRFLAYQSILQTVSQSPEILNNSVIRNIFYKMLEMQGLYGVDLQPIVQNNNQLSIPIKTAKQPLQQQVAQMQGSGEVKV